MSWLLLIVAALDDARLRSLFDRARSLELDVLVEVHDEAELERALALDADLIGVNNRNLKTFETDLAVSERLAARLDDPGIVFIAESGIATPQDVARLERAGAAEGLSIAGLGERGAQAFLAATVVLLRVLRVPREAQI